MLVLLKKINLTLRGIMEFGIVAALAVWGYHAGTTTLAKIILAFSAPVVIFGFWGLVDFRNAGDNAEYLRLIQELIISGLASYALYCIGAHSLGITLAVISIIHHIFVYVLHETLLKK